MRRCILFAVLMIASFALAQAGVTDDATKIEAAKQSAQIWLDLMDSGNYSGNWELSDTVFKGGIHKPQWEVLWRSVREPLGTFQSRAFKKAEFKTHVSDDPKEDKWIVIQYDSTFATRTASELIAMKQDKDGQWRVAGYNVQPGQAVITASNSQSASTPAPAPPQQ